MFNFKKIIKAAMTLGELLIVFTIIGIIASMCIISAKPFDKSLKYSYHRVYDSLGTAFYNAINSVEFPETSEDFCKSLLLYINTTAGGAANCSAPLIDINLSSSALDNILKTTAPHFVASNGIRFWLGSAGASAGKGYTEQSFTIDGVTAQVKFFIVIADLNGTTGPNTTNWTPNDNLADIVAFLVTETAEVIPLGGPEVDPRYLLARVVYSAQSNGVENEDIVTSGLMTYYQAKRKAWATGAGYNGIQSKIDEQMSLNFYAGGNILETSPFYLNPTDIPNEDEFTENYDEEHCSTENADGTHSMSIEACYIKISDFY